MATVIFSRGALLFATWDLYKKLDELQQKLFAYYHHVNKGDDELAMAAFNEYLEMGDQIIEARKALLQKHAEWARWQAERRNKQVRRKNA
ncbi:MULTISPECIES: hypothetical protein [Rodentibacter]|uniref:hypothetical protein n=1 Tax=Rodentibacter TaxID=1960084 RepID=UPI001CFDD293|nr:hypothetical protein [Rodentibacter sp. JRC1]GJI55875.1 hypothetical protein HEMROJRC1_09870 [Rodentibacter sp. JRC1]